MLCQSSYAQYDTTTNANYCLNAPVSTVDPTSNPVPIATSCNFTAYNNATNPS